MVQEFLAKSKRSWADSKACVFLNRRKKTILYAIFAVALLVHGITYAFLIPMGQVPDEITHYEMIEQEFGTEGYVRELINGVWFPGGFSAIPWHETTKMNIDAAKSVASTHFSKPLSLSDFHFSITALRHLPAGLGFYLGIALGLPMLTCTYVAEIFSILFYVGIGYLVLKTAPVKKVIFAFCLLIPECVQQCSSVSYDAVVIPISLLLFAYILNLYNRNQPIRWKQVCCVILLTFVLLVVKAPYALIALTMLIIPAERFELKIGQKVDIACIIHKYRVLILLALAVLSAVAIYALRDTSMIKTVIADILSFPDFLKLLRRTYGELGFYHITQSIGMFGWLDSEVSNCFILLFVGMMVWLNATRTEIPERELKPGNRIWIVFVAIAVVMACEIAIQEYSFKYLEMDMNGSISHYRGYINELYTVLGFQGRYLIPVLPIALVGLSGKINRKGTAGYYAIQIGYYVYAFVMVVQIFRYRYWI